MKNGKYPISEYIGDADLSDLVNSSAVLYNNFLVVTQWAFTEPLLCVRHCAGTYGGRWIEGSPTLIRNWEGHRHPWTIYKVLATCIPCLLLSSKQPHDTGPVSA